MKVVEKSGHVTVFDLIGIFFHEEVKNGKRVTYTTRVPLKQGMGVAEVMQLLEVRKMGDVADKLAPQHARRSPWHTSWLQDWEIHTRSMEGDTYDELRRLEAICAQARASSASVEVAA